MTGDVELERIVVGAGLTGLAIAWRSVASGARTVLFEASSRVGGVLRTEQLGPWRVERAAAAFPSTAARLLALHAALPNAPTIRRPPPEVNGQLLWTRSGLRALPKTPPALLASPLLRVGEKIRLLSEVLRAPRRSAEPESAYDFTRRRLGAAVAERFLRPMTLGIYGTRPEMLGVADAFPTLAAMETANGTVLRALRARRGATTREIWTFEEGMEAFPRAIASTLPNDIVRADTSVSDVCPAADSICVRTGDGASVRARSLVLTTTAPEQARLVAAVSPEASALLQGVRYVPMLVASVGLSVDDARRAPPAFGFLRAPGARGRILGAAFASNLNPGVAPEGHALWNVFLGGDADPDALLLSDEDVLDVIGRDLSVVLGAATRPVFCSIARWSRAIPVFAPGHRARMVRANALLAPHRIAISGSHVTGVGVDARAGAAP